MTAVLEETDVREFVVLDEETPEPCEDVHCDRVADWVITMACCGGKLLFCQMHFDSILEDINEGVLFYCSRCKTGNQTQPILFAKRIRG